MILVKNTSIACRYANHHTIRGTFQDRNSVRTWYFLRVIAIGNGSNELDKYRSRIEWNDKILEYFKSSSCLLFRVSSDILEVSGLSAKILCRDTVFPERKFDAVGCPLSIIRVHLGTFLAVRYVSLNSRLLYRVCKIRYYS